MLLLAYFRTPVEALHLALSPDGLDWTALNQNRPILEGTQGSRSLRDPFLMRDEEGTFHLLATNGWRAHSLVHATSRDLVRWSEQVLVPVMGAIPHTRNVWAPEAFFDARAQLYRLIWSSSVRPSEAPRGDDWDHRIWTCSTSDFQRFSPPEIFFDPGHSVIDATVLPVRTGSRSGGAETEYWMAFKDERGANDAATPGKKLYIARSHDPMQFTSAWRERPSAPLTSALCEGPALIHRREHNDFLLLFDRFMEASYGALLSGDGRAWREARASLPDITRHAGVLEIEDDLAARLQASFG